MQDCNTIQKNQTIAKQNFKKLTLLIVLQIVIVWMRLHRPYSHTLIEVMDVKTTLQDVPDTDPLKMA
jgi:hypothetical protein